MFKKKVKERTLLEKTFEDRLIELKGMSGGSDEYKVALANVKLLHDMMLAEMPKRKVNVDTIVSASSNLLGIGMILGFEKVNVVTSKALGFVTKTKL